MFSSPIITVAVPTFNRHHLLRTVLDAIFGQSLAQDCYEILIIDNSTDWRAAEDFYAKARLDPRVRVVWSNPPGLSRARNRAVENCTTPYIAFLDDDAVPDPGWLAAIIEGFRHSARTVAVGGPIRPIWAKERPDWLPETWLVMFTIHEPTDSDCDLGPNTYVYGTNMAFAVDALRLVGGFPEQLDRTGSGTLLSMGEEPVQDALRAQGGLIRYMKGAVVRHLVQENRIRRNWMRSRVAWQSVSEQMAEPSRFCRDWSVAELRQLAATNPNVAAAMQLLFAPAAREALSDQLRAVCRLVALLLGAHTMDDYVTESFAGELGASAGPVTGASVPIQLEMQALRRELEDQLTEARETLARSATEIERRLQSAAEAERQLSELLRSRAIRLVLAYYALYSRPVVGLLLRTLRQAVGRAKRLIRV